MHTPAEYVKPLAQLPVVGGMYWARAGTRSAAVTKTPITLTARAGTLIVSILSAAVKTTKLAEFSRIKGQSFAGSIRINQIDLA